MGIFGLSGFKTALSAGLAVTLTCLLAWTFASSTASIQWLGSDAVTATVASIHTESGDIQNA